MDQILAVNFKHKMILLFFITFFALFSFSQTFNFGPHNVGDSSVEFDLNDFVIVNKNKNIQAKFNSNSLRWKRTEKNQLTPLIQLEIESTQLNKPLYFKVNQQLYYASYQNQKSKISIEVNLMEPQLIQVFEEHLLIDELQINTRTHHHSKNRQWIDYSCKAYQVQTAGFEFDYSSIGCKMHLLGNWGDEKPHLEVQIISPQSRALDGTPSPFILYFDRTETQDFRIMNSESKSIETISIRAVVPDQMHRIKLAGGLGPYVFNAKENTDTLGPQTSASFMLYGKLGLTETSSLKAFDALIWDHTFFNNSGLYYSYDLAQLLDGQVVFGALLGFQGLHFQYDSNTKMNFEMIFPQGFELTYLDPFGFKNRYVNYGMFLSTTSDVYKNIWLRIGSKTFYELNYIEWGNKIQKIDMWGLSIGFPLGQFL